MKLVENVRSLLRKRVDYLRTKRALQDMSGRVARDLGIDRAAAGSLARHAVYGA